MIRKNKQPEVRVHESKGYWQLALIRPGQTRLKLSYGAMAKVPREQAEHIAASLTMLFRADEARRNPEIAELYFKLKEASDPACKLRRDGPRPPNIVRYEGVDHVVRPQTCRILGALWRLQRMERRAFEAAVWGRKRPGVEARKKAISYANRKLAAMEVPWRLHTAGEYLEKRTVTGSGTHLVTSSPGARD